MVEKLKKNDAGELTKNLNVFGEKILGFQNKDTNKNKSRFIFLAV